MGMLIGLVFWGAVIYGIVYLITHLGKSRSADTQAGQVALEILKRRYASGEINTEEFEKRRKTLES
ncbi:MAG TPA: SHOCT domain-containing protein [bacterium]|jgi:putative membrane protein